MPLTKLIIPPDQQSYQVSDGIETLRVDLDGGAGRYRKDKEGATRRVSVSWTVNGEKYQYLRAFYNSVAKAGSLPFLIDLFMDDDKLTEHTAYFVPGSVKFTQRGLTFSVSAELEAVPIPPDESTDLTLVMYHNTNGFS